MIALLEPTTACVHPLPAQKARCERCKRKRVVGERFCWLHRYRELRAMKRSRYLTPVPRVKWRDDPKVLDAEVCYDRPPQVLMRW